MFPKVGVEPIIISHLHAKTRPEAFYKFLHLQMRLAGTWGVPSALKTLGKRGLMSVGLKFTQQSEVRTIGVGCRTGKRKLENLTANKRTGEPINTGS